MITKLGNAWAEAFNELVPVKDIARGAWEFVKFLGKSAPATAKSLHTTTHSIGNKVINTVDATGRLLSKLPPKPTIITGMVLAPPLITGRYHNDLKYSYY